MVVVFVPTLDRPTLPKLIESLGNSEVVLVRGHGSMMQIMERAKSIESEFIPIADDDTIAPSNWLALASEALKDPMVGYVCGPLCDGARNYPQMVQESFLGSFLMRDRYRLGKDGETEERGITGMGVYRRSAFIEAMESLGDIPMPGHENMIAEAMRRRGLKTVYLAAMSSQHLSRPTLQAFFRQKFKDGTGRALYYRAFPSGLVKKPFFLLPIAVLFALFWWPINIIGLSAYFALVTATTRKPRAVFWFGANHIGYALGLLWGLLR